MNAGLRTHRCTKGGFPSKALKFLPHRKGKNTQNRIPLAGENFLNKATEAVQKTRIYRDFPPPFKAP